MTSTSIKWRWLMLNWSTKLFRASMTSQRMHESGPWRFSEQRISIHSHNFNFCNLGLAYSTCAWISYGHFCMFIGARFTKSEASHIFSLFSIGHSLATSTLTTTHWCRHSFRSCMASFSMHGESSVDIQHWQLLLHQVHPLISYFKLPIWSFKIMLRCPIKDQSQGQKNRLLWTLWMSLLNLFLLMWHAAISVSSHATFSMYSSSLKPFRMVILGVSRTSLEVLQWSSMVQAQTTTQQSFCTGSIM